MKNVRWLTVATVVVAYLGVGVAPASADHAVKLTHASPPIAAQGHDLVLPLAVEGCGLFCTHFTLTVVYVTPGGKLRRVEKVVSNYPHIQATSLTVPARHVRTPAVAYWLEAEQDLCGLFGRCHTAGTRVPVAGAYSVPVDRRVPGRAL